MPRLNGSIERLNVPPRIVKGMGTNFVRLDDEPGLGYHHTLVSTYNLINVLIYIFYCLIICQKACDPLENPQSKPAM